MKWSRIISDLFLVDCSIHYKLGKYVRQFGSLNSGGPNLNAYVKSWVQGGMVFFWVRKLEGLCCSPDSVSGASCCFEKKSLQLASCLVFAHVSRRWRRKEPFLTYISNFTDPRHECRLLISSTWRDYSLLMTIWRSAEWFLCFCK